ncbi:hypothetical protein DSECCO2_581090 [anaerobic digester metagenome]
MKHVYKAVHVIYVGGRWIFNRAGNTTQRRLMKHNIGFDEMCCDRVGIIDVGLRKRECIVVEMMLDVFNAAG